MATWENIRVERSGSLGRITLNRPEARNPLDRTTATELRPRSSSTAPTPASARS